MYESPSGPSTIDDSLVPSADDAEPPVSLRSLAGTGDFVFRMLPILPKSAPKPFDALRARLPGTGGGDMLPEEFFLGDVGADPLISAGISLVGD
jgi:hypothetical protein